MRWRCSDSEDGSELELEGGHGSSRLLGLSGGDMTEQLNLSTSNVHVMLYRARLGLRECLEDHWFTGGDKS